MPYDIFISYKRKSLPTANNLYYRLTTRGYSTFFDLEEMGRDNFKLIQQYKQNIDAMPRWVYDFANSEGMPEDEYEYMLKYNRTMIKHIDDDEIADILKTLSSQTIDENNY